MKLIHLLLTIALIVPFMGCDSLTLDNSTVDNLRDRVLQLETSVKQLEAANRRLQDEKADARDRLAMAVVVIKEQDRQIAELDAKRKLAVDTIDKIKKIQEAYSVEPLSTFLGTKAPSVAAAIDFPKWKEGAEFNAQSFNYLDFMLTLVKTPQEEQALMKRFAKIGLSDEGKFDIKKFSPEIQKALEEGAKEGFAEMEEFVKEHTSDPLVSAKIFGTRAFLNKSAKENYNLDNLFILRAVAAYRGIYGNSGEEAIYPTYLVDTNGALFDASQNKYTLTFKKGEFPPVTAFWSLTMYDGKTQLLIENPINRYLLNSPMMENFVFDEDGSLTIYVQKESPGKNLESNWLPAPDGPFYAVMRLYGPKKEALEGKWVNPPMLKN